MSLAIWDHTVLPATRHKWTHSALIPARQAGTWFTYPGGTEGWVDLGDLLHAHMVYPPADVTHPSTNRARCQLITLPVTQTTVSKQRMLNVFWILKLKRTTYVLRRDKRFLLQFTRSQQLARIFWLNIYNYCFTSTTCMNLLVQHL